jgi:toxin FitB
MSGWLLDTNIPSETIRSRPDPEINAWILAQDDATLYFSVVTVGELRKGVTILRESRRRSELRAWLETDLLPLFAGRILPVMQRIADYWGVLSGKRQLCGTSARHGRRIDRGHGVGARADVGNAQRQRLRGLDGEHFQPVE